MLLALRVAPWQVRLQGPLPSWQPATDSPCKGSRFSGSPLLWTVCAVWTRTYRRCPLVVAERCVTDLEGGRGLHVPQGGQVSARSCLLVKSGALPRLARGRGTRAHSRP